MVILMRVELYYLHWSVREKAKTFGSTRSGREVRVLRLAELRSQRILGPIPLLGPAVPRFQFPRGAKVPAKVPRAPWELSSQSQSISKDPVLDSSPYSDRQCEPLTAII